MLHAKFQENRTSVYGHDNRLGHVIWTIYTNFRSRFPWILHIRFGFDWQNGLWMRRSLKIVDDGWTDGQTDRQRTDAGSWVYYKLTW